MKRLFVCCALALPLVALSTAPALAEVKTREKALVKFEGMLGRVVGIFGGKAAKEGVVTTNSVKGNRKATLSDTTGRIVDLSEEKVYELDMKKKTYTVKTFDEIRKEMREAEEKAQREVPAEEQQQPTEKEKSDEPKKEFEVDYDVKETGQKKTIAGYDARQVIMTVTVREKGKTLEEGGGLVTTSDMWMGPEIPAMKELEEFEERYWKQLTGPEVAAISAEQMAALLATYPQVKQAMERLQKEGRSAEGTALQTRTTIESVKSKEAMAQQAEASSSGGGGLGGMLSRRIMKKDPPKQRSVVMTTDTEVLEVSPTVGTEVDIPAGFKQKS
jgi:hypothetical protein